MDRNQNQMRIYYTEYPTKHHFIDVIQTQVLKNDTIILGSEKQFIKYQLK